MIKASFKLGSEVIEVIIGTQGLLFFDVSSGVITPIQGLKLSKSGVLKEFPDLENDEEWDKKAVKRLKKHLQKIQSEDGKINYVIEELRKHGYQPLYKQRGGHRPKKIK